ncbi:ABC transporter ATP-binding protein [Microbacterium suaedae]|uniref:ABC transporter ATP-binding protein n=1 Tax=Microbacterium suaedae TaxID=2067813 RepID=UPI000DA15AE8|nr:ABC transporter ATP-binding protein [Microbacterium suaedae]
MSSATITLKSVSVDLGERTILDGLSATFAAGEISIVLGPSGSGKSTILRVLAGLQRIDSGAVVVGSTPITGPSASRGLVFQHDGLLPWLSIQQNVELPLKIAGVPRLERRRRALEILDEVELSGCTRMHPSELSGGMKQRAQIARVLVTRPSVLLLDEPFSALDVRTRAACQQLLRRVHAEHRPTVVFVTHDLEEASSLGGRQLILTGRPATRLVPLPDIDEPASGETLSLNEMHARRLRLLDLFALEEGQL